MKAGWGFSLAIAVVLCSNVAWAACPATLVDGIVSGTAWSSPYEGAKGISLDSSYRVSGLNYVLSAVDPGGFEPVKLFRFSGVNHAAIGAYTTANTSTISKWNSNPDIAATVANDDGVWSSVWEGYGDPRKPESDGDELTWVRRFDYYFDPCDNPYPDTTDYETFLLPTDQHGGQYKPVVDAVPGVTKFVVGAVAFPTTESNYTRPYIRIINADGTTYLSETLVESASGWSAIDVAVDAYVSTSAGTLIAVAWSEVSSTQGYRIRFKIYNSNGTVYASARQIDPPSGYGISNVRISGVGNAVVLVWNRWQDPSGFPYGTSSFMVAYPASSGSAYYTARLVDPGSGYPTYMPDISAEKWSASNGLTYSVYSIAYYTVTQYSGNYYLYPTIHLFKTTTSPTDVTGAQYLSWYPKSTWEPLSDGVKTEVFTGCSSQVVVAGVHYADSSINPSSERGLRRSFFSVSSSGIYSASASEFFDSSIDGNMDDFSLPLESIDIDWCHVSEYPYAALENDGFLESAILLAPGGGEEDVE